jgi:multidrug efflux system outer membrane protein
VTPARLARGGVPAFALALASCVMGAPYRRPDVEVPPAFREGDAPPADARSIADLPWWQVFHDESLAALIGEALANNHDLAIAIARVEEARATAGVARADYAPAISGTASATRSQSSRASVAFGPQFTSAYSAALSASWELDLWGRVRRGAEAAFADYVASEEGRRAAIVTLVGDVAEAWFTLRSLDDELEIVRATTESRRRTSELFAKRLEGGVSSTLEAAQAAADLAEAAAGIPELESRVAQQEHALRLLLGRSPGPVARPKGLPPLDVPPALPTGFPATLVERRPDVRSAEASVVAANARVGVAYAEFLPRVSLTALLGLDSSELAHLGDADATIASIGASLATPVLQGGRLEANAALAIARRDEAAAQWRKTVRSAFRDVADQVVAIRKLAEVRVELEREVGSLDQSLGLSRSRYEAGLSAYFEVLDAQRRLLPAQLLLARTKRDQYLALVRLYRALGGGWLEGGDASCAPSGPPLVVEGPPMPPAEEVAPPATPAAAPAR